MVPIVVAALLWTFWHMGVAGTRLRDRLVTSIGEIGFRILFSLGSIVTIALLIIAYNHADFVPLWRIPAWLQWLLVVAMLPASVFFVGSIATRNPTMIDPGVRPGPGPGPLAGAAAGPRGMIRVTRHPMLWAFGIWGVVHMIANGDVASLLFFGAFAVTAFAGMRSIDAKLARRSPMRWAPLAERTSVVPGVAIADGRNRLVLSELWIPLVGGVVLFALLLGAHPHVIGVSPLPQS